MEYQSITDKELPSTIEEAKQGDPTAIYYSIVGLLERKRIAEAQAHALQLHELGFADGCGVIAERLFSPSGDAPDADRCLEFALRHASTDRPDCWASATLAGKVYEQRGQIEEAVQLYRRATSWEEVENCEAWIRLACIYLRPGPRQDPFEAARCLIGYVAADGEEPQDVADAPIEYDGAWVSEQAFHRLFESAPQDRRAELALLLFEGGLLIPKGTWKRETSFERFRRGPAGLNSDRPGAIDRLLRS